MLTLSHWIYICVIVSVIIAMVCRRDVVMICLLGIFLIGFAYTGSILSSLQIMFNALLVAGEELFDIMLVIALMVAMLKSLESVGADKIMVSPAKKVMKTPTTAFLP